MTDPPGRIFLLVATLPGLTACLLFMAGLIRRRRSPDAAPTPWPSRLAVAVMTLTAGLALWGALLFRDAPTTLAERVTWVEVAPPSAGPDAPALTIPFGYKVDHLSSALFLMVALVSALIVLFSTGYMRDELAARHEDHEVRLPGGGHYTRGGRSGRFFCYLLLFVSSMLHLLLADNLLQIFVCWELVGVCSYLLIGYYSERPAANRAALKAFILNRVGDAGFLVALAVAFAEFGTFDIDKVDISAAEPWVGWVLGLGIFAGCCGKSAQFPLHVWLPDAMEGPTPVSALIHAATMVAAGVYLAARSFTLFTPDVLLVISYTGAITLTLAALAALFQTDLKRILAYSTVSQLGYMMLAVGVGAWGAAVLHLVTHACFKALLFLGAGSVIHACHHKQDLRSMGGLRRKLPWTAGTMLVGVLAISGVPLLSGWYSKDEILAGTYAFAEHHPRHLLLAALPFVTAGLTAFYMGRLWLLTFAGEPRDAEVAEHAHESPWVMRGPLILLAIASIGVAWGWPPTDPHASALGHWLEQSSPAPPHSETSFAPGLLGLIAAASGLGLAFVLYRKGGPVVEPRKGWRRATFAAFGLDTLFRNTLRRPMVALGLVAARLDRADTPVDAPDAPSEPATLDGLFVAGARSVGGLGRLATATQTGRLADYLAVVALTLAAVLAILMHS